MNGPRTLAVVLLLCLAPIGGVVVADSHADTTAPQPQTDSADRAMTVFDAGNTSEYLAPPPDRIDRAGNRTVGLDVGAAVEADAAGLESAYTVGTLQRRYDDAATDAEREAVVEDGVERLAERADALRAADRATIRQFNRGEIGEHELLRQLTALHRAAGVTVEGLEWLETAASELGMDGAAERTASNRITLLPTNGPVRAELAAAADDGGSLNVQIETAGDGLVLAAVDRTGDTYLREAHDTEARAPGTADQYNGSPLLALERIEQLYPWVTENDLGVSASPIGPTFDRVYRFTIPHPHGELETYLDSGSESIAVEFHRNDPAALPTDRTETTGDDRRLVVETTRGGGPAGISVVDTATGEPVDARIELNGTPIGSTGGDRLWTVAPRGSVSIEATHADGTLSAELSLP